MEWCEADACCGSSQVGFRLLAKFFSNEITFIFSIDIANIAIKIIFIHALIFTTL